MSDRGFTVRRLSQVIIAGDLELAIQTDPEGVPVHVAASIGGSDSPPVQLTAEQLERIGQVLHDLRSELSDYRRVCPTHGYYDADRFVSRHRCPRCEEEQKIEAAAS